MTRGLVRISVVLLTLALVLPLTASAQGAPAQQAKDDKQSAPSAVNQVGSNAKAEKKPSSQPPLELGLKPASTADAARSAALERSEEHTSELQSPCNLVCRLLLEKKKRQDKRTLVGNC